MNLNAVKSELSHLAHSAMDSVEGTLHDGRGVITHATHATGRDLSRAVARASFHSVRGDILRTVGSAAPVAAIGAVVAMISPEVTVQWALRALGLQRRSSALARVATGTGLIVAGAAVGAGVALLLSPRSGVENRARLVRDFQSVHHEVASSLEAFGTQLQGAVHGAETMVQDVVHSAGDHTRALIRGASPMDGAASTAQGSSSTTRHVPG